MKVLAIDPSSTITGYAVMADARTLIEAGKLKPNRTKDVANVRIRAMAADLLSLIGQHKPDVVVIEDTSGKVNRGRHGGAGAGLAVYGKCIGWLLGTLEATGVKAVAVLENDWTRSVTKKERQRIVAAEFRGRGYNPAQDDGGDVSDAIGLGRWWFVEGQHRKAVA